MRIVLIGADGQLGRELQRQLDEQVIVFGHAQVEITDPQSAESAIADAAANLVINVAAYNQVDRAEDEPDVAYRVNALGPRNLALCCEDRGIPLLHVSSDFVFGLDSNQTKPCRETDATGPLSAYGVSKLAGECFVRALCRRHFVVRTCGLYGCGKTPGTGNFVETILRLAKQRNELSVVDDQTCTPTSTADLARAIQALIATVDYGLYHATNTGSTTWYRFACEIVRLRQCDVRVRPISSEEFGAKALRPSYSVLDNRKLAETIGFALPPWQEALVKYLNDQQT